MGKKRRTEKKNHLFDWLNVLGVLEPRWMRIIIPITVPNQKNTGNKNVVVVVMRRHSLRLLAGWYRRFGYNFLSYIYLCWRLCRPIYFGFPLRTVIMINFNRTSRVKEATKSWTSYFWDWKSRKVVQRDFFSLCTRHYFLFDNYATVEYLTQNNWK